jgi:predicted DNA-binding ribbon-helix-helix protein
MPHASAIGKQRCIRFRSDQEEAVQRLADQYRPAPVNFSWMLRVVIDRGLVATAAEQAAGKKTAPRKAGRA